MPSDDITVVIPTIPPRRALLHRAIQSVTEQTYPAAALAVVTDLRKEGAPKTRQRALDMVKTPLVAFLDDDDEFMRDHLLKLLGHMRDTGADYVYSWYKVVGYGGVVFNHDPVFPRTHFTEPWDNANPRQTTITTLVRTELAQEVGFLGLPEMETGDGNVSGEDWNFTLGCMNAGGKISHLVDHTWYWHHDSQNTSGRPERW